MRKFIFCCFIIFIFSSYQCLAQSNVNSILDKVNDMENAADYMFQEGNYYAALRDYKQLIKIAPEPRYKMRAGICYLYKGDEREKALKYLLDVYDNDPTTKNILFYLGRAYHINYQFDTAVAYFNKYLATNPPKKMEALTERYINYCHNAKILMGDSVKVNIHNLGAPVNTEASEYAPVISSDESTLIFTYRGPRSKGGRQNPDMKPDSLGEYYEDIFISQKVGSDWLDPEGIDNLNTNGHDASIALSADGQTLFTFQSSKHNKGDIYVSHLNGNLWSKPEKLDKNINSSSWEGSCSISADGKTLYFASERPGGYGGRDIYVSQRNKKGKWGKAVNLGATVNTPYNDDAPFIHSDGKTLFFSSEGHNSMGGSDVFYTKYENGAWTDPVNMGYPINSPGDDKYYVMSADGRRGYFSSDRKGGAGEEDIYTATPGMPQAKPSVLVLIVGAIKGDNQPANATIKVMDVKTGEEEGVYHSNASTGKYLLTLTPGSTYKITNSIKGMNSRVEYLDVDTLNKFVELKQDLHLFSKKYIEKHPEVAADTATNMLQQQMNKKLGRPAVPAVATTSGNKQAGQGNANQALANNASTSQSTTGNAKMSGQADSTTATGNQEVAANNTQQQGNGNANMTGQNATTIGGNQPVIANGTTNQQQGNAPANGTSQNQQQAGQATNQQVATNNTQPSGSGNAKMTNQNTTATGGNQPVANSASTETQSQGNAPNNMEQGQTTGTGSASQPITASRVSQDMLTTYGHAEMKGLAFDVVLPDIKGDNDPKLAQLKKYGHVTTTKQADGSTQYSMGPFTTLAAAHKLTKQIQSTGASTAVAANYNGQESSVADFFNNSCHPDPSLDFSYFAGKDLNDTTYYNALIRKASNMCVDGLTFTVQIGAYRHPQNYHYKNLRVFGIATVTPYPDGITRFTMKTFKTLRSAEMFRQEVIGRGTKDAWITAIYQGKRVLLQGLIAVNFHNKSIN